MYCMKIMPGCNSAFADTSQGISSVVIEVWQKDCIFLIPFSSQCLDWTAGPYAKHCDGETSDYSAYSATVYQTLKSMKYQASGYGCTDGNLFVEAV